MGYSMYLMEAKFRIPKQNHKKALQAIKSLKGKETIKDDSGKHFSWVHTEDFLKAKTLQEALEVWRWPPILDEEGNIVGIQFTGEKLGDEDILFSAIAPYVEAGSYIQMMGEDGYMWRWVFDGKTVKRIEPKITWH